MPRRVTAALLVAAFSLTCGHLLWNATAGPPPSREYFVESGGLVLASPDGSAKNLYLRRVIALSQRPRHAWLQVIGRDRLRVYVNGEPVAGGDRDGLPLAALVDLTAHLNIGLNVIAITARQSTASNAPVVSVDGEYLLSNGQSRSIRPDGEWRSASHFEHAWTSPAFQDRHWAVARVVPGMMRSAVYVPPGALTTAGTASWITPPSADGGRVAVRRIFDVEERPARAWLRLTSTAAYRVAVNGVLLDEREDDLGTDEPVPVVRRSYDVTTTVRKGSNVVAVLLTRTGRLPQLLADLEVETRDGSRVYVGTDGRWLGRSPPPPDWLDTDASETSIWETCRVESGDAGFPPWLMLQQHVNGASSLSVAARHLAWEAAFLLVFAGVVWTSCSMAARRVGPVAYLALLPATAGLTTALVASYDPRIGGDVILRPSWLALAILSVPLQWYLFGRVPLSGRWTLPPAFARVSGQAVLVAALAAAAFWLRIGGAGAEPLQWDEVEHYEYTLGFFERGFPSREVHRDLPIAYVHTSELMFVPSALASLLFDDARLVMRVPAVCWSVLSVLLVYFAGRRMFGPPVGLVAAAVLALSPVSIAMSTFGRYFAQLQFLTLLVVYAFWMAIRGTGPLNRPALVVTALSFVAMYLTWEGAAFLAVGMTLAAIMHRWERLQTLVADRFVWLALLAVAMAVVAQHSHVVLQQTQFLWYGTSLSDLRVRPMWDYPTFRPWFYVWASSWSLDALVPMAGLVGAVLLSARHAFRYPLRFLLMVHLATCLFTASLLPAMAWRYAHHLMPILVLLASAALVALARGLVRFGRPAARAHGARAYARGVAAVLVATTVIVGSGFALDLRGLTRFRVEGVDTSRFKFPNLEGPSRYVRERLQPGDAILATDPFHVKRLMGFKGDPGEPVFFWPASVLQLSATLDDSRPLALDRRDGTPAIVDLPGLRHLFTRYQRIWYIVQPERHENQNVPGVTAFLRQQMDVVYEDFESAVLFRDQNHRRAAMRYEEEAALNLEFRNRSNFPPEPRFPPIPE